jgi:hypothetical protein
VIAQEQHPDHTVISEFRRRHLQTLQDLFLQTVRLCQAAGLVKLGRVALDGTKVKANASKHKAMSYDRMLKSEAELKAEIDQLLTQAEATDQEEDRRHGKGRRGDEVPAELRRREDRRTRIAAARAALEAEAQAARKRELEAQAEAAADQARTAPDEATRERAAARAEQKTAAAEKLAAEPAPEPESESEWPQHQVPHTPEGKPTDKAQRNFTDPESRIMKRDGAYLQGYNAQAAVDAEHQVIVGCGLTNQAPDVQHLPPMLDAVHAVTGSYPEQLLADAGYWDETHVDYCEARGVDPYLATGRQPHGEPPPTVRGRPPADLDAKGRMRRKLHTQRGRATYAQRKQIVEPVFGQIREAQGFRHLLLRGLEQARAEWALICAAHNLLKLHRAGLQPA